MIVMISAVFPPEPVVSASLSNDLAIGLSEKYCVKVLTPKPSRPLGYSFKEGVSEKRKFEQIILDSYTFPKSKLFGRMRESYSFGKHAVSYISENKNKINCLYIDAWPLMSQYLIIRIAKRHSIPTVVHVQDIYPESLIGKLNFLGSVVIRILLPLDKYILKNATQVVAISGNMKETFVKTRGIDLSKITVIHNWQNESDFINYKNLNKSETRRKREEQFTLMYLGNIGPVAGLEFLIEAFAKANLKGIRLIISGSGSTKPRCIKIAKSFPSPNIEFWDVPDGKVPEIQDKADILLLPIRKGAAMSSVPSKLIAYMFSAKPVISLVDEVSDSAHTIKSANCGWIVPPDNYDSFIEMIKNVACIPAEELKKLGTNGFNYAMENFSKKENLQKLINLIDKTTSK